MRIEERFQTGCLLKNLSTFGIGGPIRHYLPVRSEEEATLGIQWAKSHCVPYFLLGKGSNCLFHDQGFNGLVIHNQIDFCSLDGVKIYVGAGYSFARLGAQTASHGLSGLEFASGIPGTVGGAIYMNAGSNGRDTSQVLQEVEFIAASGEKRIFSSRELFFSYRKSSFQTMSGMITAARFLLAENIDAKKNQQEMLSHRKKSQPLNAKSAGCTFRHPLTGLSAGALIDQCQLKGFCVGGAKVSEVHANFIVNVSNATQSDVAQLIALVQERVFQQTGVRLEPEVRMVGTE